MQLRDSQQDYPEDYQLPAFGPLPERLVTENFLAILEKRGLHLSRDFFEYYSSASPSGNMNSDICLSVWENGWIPELERIKEELKIPHETETVHSNDNFSAHLNDKVLKVQTENLITVHCIISHGSGDLSALDLETNPLLKCVGKKDILTWVNVVKMLRQNLLLADLPKILQQSIGKATSGSMIDKAWAASGLSPFNPDVRLLLPGISAQNVSKTSYEVLKTQLIPCMAPLGADPLLQEELKRNLPQSDRKEVTDETDPDLWPSTCSDPGSNRSPRPYHGKRRKNDHEMLNMSETTARARQPRLTQHGHTKVQQQTYEIIHTV